MKISAGALIFYRQELLILQPSYRDYWLSPGGAALEGESPHQAYLREIKEETNLNVEFKQLLCVDYLSTGTKITGKQFARTTDSDEITFLFLAEDLDESQLDMLRVDGKEIIQYQFLTPERTIPFLPSYLENRLPHCLQAIKMGGAQYLEGGEPPTPR